MRKFLPFLLVAGLAACSDSNSGSQNNAAPTLNANDSVQSAPVYFDVDVKTPAPSGSGFLNLGSVPLSRQVPAKTLSLTDFHRTIENTDIELQVKLKDSKDTGQVELFSRGERLAQAKLGESAILKFTTPKLTDDERLQGYAVVAYDLVFDNGDANSKRTQSFSLNIHDENRPSLAVERPERCVVHELPQLALGCTPNRTRAVQLLTINDDFQVSHQVSVTYSGQVGISVSVVQIQLGMDYTKTNGTQTDRGSQIQFSLGIECAAVVYRQVVEENRLADVYTVRADGSQVWSGHAVVTSRAIAYDFETSPSESNSYDCSGLSSHMNVGSDGSCSAFGAMK